MDIEKIKNAFFKLGKVDQALLAKNKMPDKLYITHPSLRRLIQKAFTVKDGGKKYKFYCFKEIHDMPARRFSTLNDFIEDNNRRMTMEEVQHYSEEIIKQINANSVEGVTNAMLVAKFMKQRAEVALNTDMVLRLISCAYFLKDEDLLRYDWDMGDWKIDLFERHGLLSFFLTMPSNNFAPLMNISPGDMRLISQQQKFLSDYLMELSKLGISTINPYEKRKNN